MIAVLEERRFLLDVLLCFPVLFSVYAPLSDLAVVSPDYRLMQIVLLWVSKQDSTLFFSICQIQHFAFWSSMGEFISPFSTVLLTERIVIVPISLAESENKN